MSTSEKIQALETLAATVTEQRSQRKRVVLSHGVFDVLHVGHIRHFERAREFGELLVVTVTPDEYVNKGPGRPVFSQDLRAEAIAALDCVDYVAINDWPTAVETMKMLKPDYYVKGSEYRDAADDVTGEIVNEKNAIESVGGQLVFTDDIVFSSSNLINRNMSGFSEEVSEYLRVFSEKHGISKLRQYVEGAAALKVLVVGETIIDEYQYCNAIGKSSKEPTLVVKAGEQESFAGGAVAIANHVAGFCGNVSLLTCLGSRNSRRDFIEERLADGVARHFITKGDSPTIVKRRFVDSYFFTKLLEVYEMNDDEMAGENDRELCAELEKLLSTHDMVIVADYGHGMLSRQAVKLICEKAPYLALNVQANAGNRGYHTVSTYSRADLLSVAESEIRLEARDRSGDLETMVEKIVESLGCKGVVVTRGSNGSLCYDSESGFKTVPAVAQKIVDRIGAGDASLSVASLFAVQGAPIEVVGFAGNVAGALSVATVCNKSAVDKVQFVKFADSLLK